MASFLELTASSARNLNGELQSINPEQAQGSIFLTVKTTSWRVTRWHIDTFFDSAHDIEIGLHIEGATTFSYAKRNPTNQNFYRLTYHVLWETDVIPEMCSLAIYAKDMAMIKGIICSDDMSFWQVLKLIRKDLTLKKQEHLLSWSILHGFKEYNYLQGNRELIDSLNHPADKVGSPTFHWLLWNQREDLQKSFLSLQTPRFETWLKEHGTDEHRLPINPATGKLEYQKKKILSLKDREFGVNLFGYYSEELGIGEDCRTVATALKQAGILVQIINIPTRSCSNELRDLSNRDPDKVAPYAFNLYCMTCEEHARIVMELGQSILCNRYCIGYWPWELSQWPEEWIPLLSLVDEVWTSSQFTYNSLKHLFKHKEAQLQLLPLSLKDQKVLRRDEIYFWRSKFNIPNSAIQFICSFDGRSSFWRKNPWGAIKAFQLAFPSKQIDDPINQPVRLIIKAMHGSMNPQAKQELHRLCSEDHRINYVDEILERDQLLGLYSCCDALISLHRSEGFGRVMAEAFLAGLDIIATNYSGNCDFCDGPLFHPIGYQERKVMPEHYIHTDGQVWAEPNQLEAASALQFVARLRSTDNIQRRKLSEHYQEKFSTFCAGTRYEKRLNAIWNQHPEMSLTLRWQSQNN